MPLDNNYNDFLCMVGINFAFGGGGRSVPVKEAQIEEPVAPAAATVSSADADRDGVPDAQDDCPRSPAGAVVDKRGCLPDYDEDGILDYEDHCLNTPAGVKVDRDGCPSDSDFDGVSDYLTSAPHSDGTLVDENGCPLKNKSMLLKMEFDSGKAVIKKKYQR